MLQELELHLGPGGQPEVSKGKKLLNMLKGKAEQPAAMEPAAALVRGPGSCY